MTCEALKAAILTRGHACAAAEQARPRSNSRKAAPLPGAGAEMEKMKVFGNNRSSCVIH